MGLIKALTSSTGSVLGDQFKEFVTCPAVEPNVLMARGLVQHGDGNKNPTDGVITNGSKIVAKIKENCVFVDYPCTHYLGGAGLVSTLSDYLKFAKMLLNNGKTPKKQIF